MQVQNFNTRYFLALLVISGAGVLFIFWPFVGAISVAAVLAVVLHGTYEGLVRWTRGREILSASLMCVLVALLIVLPLVAVSGLVAIEAKGAYDRYFGNIDAFKNVLANLNSFLLGLHIPGFKGLDFLDAESISGNIQDVSKVVFNVAQKTYTQVSGFVLWLFVMFFSFFYFVIDGKKLVAKLIRLSPLHDEQEHTLVDNFRSISRATLKGTIVLGLIQGFLGGVIFSITGITSPVTWGVVMAVLSIVPMVGAGLIWFPIGVGALLLGHVWEGATILAFGAFVISTVDNLLRPRLVGRDAEMHPLIVFFATVGGIIKFGFFGFVIGPIIAALFLALLKIYEEEFSKQLIKYNR